MNQSCLLRGFSQASYREGPEFAGRFQESMKPMTHLGPKNCPSLCGKLSALTQSSKTPKVSEGARQLAVI